MAFQQPSLPPTVRQITHPGPEKHSPTTLSSPHQARPERSQEWVLFPNACPRSDAYTQTASSRWTSQTVDLSKASEFGSMSTAAKSGLREYDPLFDEDEDLDSLVDGLRTHQEQNTPHHSSHFDQSGSVLPTHDGLGSFPPSSRLVQEQLWRLEQNNSHRRSFGHHRRHSSVQRRLDALEVDDTTAVREQRTERIEKWRAEHSRILLEEVERESRRRRVSLGSRTSSDQVGDTAPKHLASPSLVETTSPNQEMTDQETFWQSITRRIIRDIMGVNDELLQSIFGESLVLESSSTFPHTRLLTPDSHIPGRSLLTNTDHSWENRLLARLSRELGLFLQRFSGGVTPYNVPIDAAAFDYAGIPIDASCPKIGSKETLAAAHETERGAVPYIEPSFKPTIHQQNRPPASESSHAALWGIEEEDLDSASALQDREYWEQTPSLKTIFRFVHQHFTSHRRPLQTSSNTKSKPSNIATRSTPDLLRRAAIIRQHHPLVSRQYTRRTSNSGFLGGYFPHHGGSGNPTLMSSCLKRSEGSCASLGLRRGKKGSGSSRNYWDVGSSIGSSNIGGIGVWGEV